MTDAKTSLTDIFRDRRSVFLRVLTRRLGNLDEAEEVLQEAFINFERAAKNQEIANPGGYLMQIALNLAVDRIRQDSSRRRREESWFDANSAGQIGAYFVASNTPQDQALIAKQELQRLIDCLEALSPQVRTAFILHKIKGLSHIETAENMGLARSTIEKHIMKAMKYVADQMAEDAP